MGLLLRILQAGWEKKLHEMPKGPGQRKRTTKWLTMTKGEKVCPSHDKLPYSLGISRKNTHQLSVLDWATIPTRIHPTLGENSCGAEQA